MLEEILSLLITSTGYNEILYIYTVIALTTVPVTALIARKVISKVIKSKNQIKVKNMQKESNNKKVKEFYNEKKSRRNKSNKTKRVGNGKKNQMNIINNNSNLDKEKPKQEKKIEEIPDERIENNNTNKLTENNNTKDTNFTQKIQLNNYESINQIEKANFTNKSIKCQKENGNKEINTKSLEQCNNNVFENDNNQKQEINKLNNDIDENENNQKLHVSKLNIKNSESYIEIEGNKKIEPIMESNIHENIITSKNKENKELEEEICNNK